MQPPAAPIRAPEQVPHASSLTARDMLDLARAAFDKHGPKDTDHQLTLEAART